jgi:sugar phosphate isomerase/epimerase
MKYSVFTASTPEWTPTQAATILARQGWDGIEWRITDQDEADIPGFWAGNRATWPLTGLEASIEAIRAATVSAGLEFSGIGGYVRSHDRPNVERLLAATAALDARQVRVTMPLTSDGEYRDLFAITRSDLAWAAARAAGYGVKALVELHHGTIAASASAAVRLVDGLDPAHVGVIHDIGNLIIEGYEEPLAAFQMLGPYLAHVHVKNVSWHVAGGSPQRTVWAERWAPLRHGQADLPAYFKALAAYGYDGWVTVEDFSTVQPLADRTRDNLAYLRSLCP